MNVNIWGMKVNVWEATEQIEALIRSGDRIDAARLRDPAVPLEEPAPARARGESADAPE
ncbi:MAG TPA: hypothetical protein VK919_14815 [Solirubrobacterales bacterium]|nr:hypothetical protein [Solirubrobacterales bacterium]